MDRIEETKMNYYRTRAIVLKRENIFESDRLYHLYTEDFGGIKAAAGGAQKINAKLAGHLEPFNLVWVEVAAKKSGDLFITTALSYKQLLGRNASPTQIAVFFKMADLILKMTRESLKDGVLWDFIFTGFEKAGPIKIGEADAFLSDFKNGFIKLLGFGDDFDKARYYLNDFGVL